MSELPGRTPTLPDQIVVSGMTFDVEAVHEGPLHPGDADCTTLGRAYLDGQRIAVRVGHAGGITEPVPIGPDVIRDTLLHEVVHVAAYAGQIALKEREVTVLSTILLDTLRRNPALCWALLEGTL